MKASFTVVQQMNTQKIEKKKSQLSFPSLPPIKNHPDTSLLYPKESNQFTYDTPTFSNISV